MHFETTAASCAPNITKPLYFLLLEASSQTSQARSSKSMMVMLWSRQQALSRSWRRCRRTSLLWSNRKHLQRHEDTS